ncbi:MAG: ABC transporter permease, partial [Thermoplasmata archaeon]
IEDINQEVADSENLDIDDFDYIDSAYRGIVPSIERDGNRGIRSVIGIDQNFIDNNLFGFTAHSKEYGSKTETWKAVLNDPSLTVTNAPPDGSFNMGAMDGDSLKLNDTITLLDVNGDPVKKRVVGLMNQSAVTGLFMSKDTVRNEFGVSSSTLFFFSVKEEVDADEIGRELEKEFIQFGFQPLVIDTLLREAFAAQFMFFDLFSGYMALGLVVGIAGLGIISLRAVHERRLEIGMMRAIGFKRRMIRYVFLIENSFITLAGIVLGSLLGIGVGWMLWYDGFEPMGWQFYIPWPSIIAIGIIAYLAMLLTAIPSAQKASKVSPAEALRFD